MYAFDAKYSPMGSVTIRIVKNNSVFRAETKELSFPLKYGGGPGAASKDALADPSIAGPAGGKIKIKEMK